MAPSIFSKSADNRIPDQQIPGLPVLLSGIRREGFGHWLCTCFKWGKFNAWYLWGVGSEASLKSREPLSVSDSNTSPSKPMVWLAMLTLKGNTPKGLNHWDQSPFPGKQLPLQQDSQWVHYSPGWDYFFPALFHANYILVLWAFCVFPSKILKSAYKDVFLQNGEKKNTHRHECLIYPYYKTDLLCLNLAWLGLSWWGNKEKKGSFSSPLWVGLSLTHTPEMALFFKAHVTSLRCLIGPIDKD